MNRHANNQKLPMPFRKFTICSGQTFWWTKSIKIPSNGLSIVIPEASKSSNICCVTTTLLFLSFVYNSWSVKGIAICLLKRCHWTALMISLLIWSTKWWSATSCLIFAIVSSGPAPLLKLAITLANRSNASKLEIWLYQVILLVEFSYIKQLDQFDYPLYLYEEFHCLLLKLEGGPERIENDLLYAWLVARANQSSRELTDRQMKGRIPQLRLYSTRLNVNS